MRAIWLTKSSSVRVGPIDGATTVPRAPSKLAINVKVPRRIEGFEIGLILENAPHGTRRWSAQCRVCGLIGQFGRGCEYSGLDDLQPLLDNFSSSFVLEPVNLLNHHVKEHSVPPCLTPFQRHLRNHFDPAARWHVF